MADNLYFDDAVKIDGGEEVALSATNVLTDSLDITDVQAQNAGIALSDAVKIDGEENVSLSVDMVITESVILSDVFNFLRNFFHLAQRVFTVRLRK